jgi:hypothetical protein
MELAPRERVASQGVVMGLAKIAVERGPFKTADLS